MCTLLRRCPRVPGIVQKYSNFVGFPILLNGDKLNTIQPLWTLPKEAVTEEQHKGAIVETMFLVYASGLLTAQSNTHEGYGVNGCAECCFRVLSLHLWRCVPSLSVIAWSRPALGPQELTRHVAGHDVAPYEKHSSE